MSRCKEPRLAKKVNLMSTTIVIILFAQPCIMLYAQHSPLSRYTLSANVLDPMYAESETLNWIRNNFDLDNSVVVSNTGWDPGGERAGLHYRILEAVGNNVYFGNISDLLLDIPDARGNANTYVGLYSSLNVDWTLTGKTIIIDSDIYIIRLEEKQHLVATEMNGVYVYVEN